MAPEKVTNMVVDVDLNCSDCYKKVKKVMNQIPEIRDQEYDVEKNQVKIRVICCSPERIRDKLRNKGGRSVQKVDIVLDKPKEPAVKPKPKPEKLKKPKKSDPSPKPEVAKMIFETPVQGYPQMYPPTYHHHPMVGYEGYLVTPQQSSGYYYGFNSDYFSEQNPQVCYIK